MTSLKWFRYICPNNFFSRNTVANRIAYIAGGDSKQYLIRAGKMIKESKKRGIIECAVGCKNYYRFK